MAKLTVFQKLNRALWGVDGERPTDPVQQDQIYNVNRKELLSTHDKAKFDEKKLELQQSKYLHDKWVKVDSELYNKATMYEVNRQLAFYDFEGMEQTPEIGVALDSFSEESTQPSEKGHILTIYSESKRVKSILADLFNNKLDVNTNLQMWTRNVCKYGDNFLFLKLDPEKGIVGCNQLPNLEIERLEGKAYLAQQRNISDQNKELKPKEVKFTWKAQNLEFQAFEIAHFRILGDDRRLPYGTSLLEKARRVWRQLVLAEDAMLIYRTSRAPERRVFKVYVGNMEDADVEPYVQRVASKFKRDAIADPKTGNVDTRYSALSVDQDFFIPVRDVNAPNPIDTLPGACIALDTKISLLDGRTLELQEIIKEWDEGNRNLWVYSCDPKTGAFIPLPITWAGVTKKNTQVLRIILDNGESVVATPDHKFVHRTNGFVEAQNLKEGDSLMPFYIKKEVLYSKNGYEKDYLKIFDNEKQEWLWTHKEVAKFYKNKIVNNYIFNYNKDNVFNTIHHIDVNRFNNCPTNLCYMGFKDHLDFHSKNLQYASKAFSEKFKNDENFRKKMLGHLKKGMEKHHHNLKNDLEYRNKVINKQKESFKLYFESLTDEEKKQRFLKNINSPEANAKTLKKLLEWRKDPENNKIVGEKISEAYTPERKEQHIERTKELWKTEEHRKKVFRKEQKVQFSDELYNLFVAEFEKNGRADLALNNVNNSKEFMELFYELNREIRSSYTNLIEFTHNHLDKMLKSRGYTNYRDWMKKEASRRGYKNIRAWRYYIDKEYQTARTSFYNHKIIKIEWLEEKQDTGTITVDGNELYSNAHTFGIQCGIYISNSNLSEIEDIEYIQKKLLAALRIPKAFIGYEEVVGDGKGLSIMDIRFARTINKIQKALVQELNKIAIIHLLMLGLDDELENFTLGLTNPSTQSELLKIEQWKEKILLYKDAVGDPTQGIAPVSHTFAKKYFLGMSDSEVKLDLQQQKMERGINEELLQSKNIKSGLFNVIDRLYSTGEPASGTTENEGTTDFGLPPLSSSSSPSIPTGGEETTPPTEEPTGAPGGTETGAPTLSETLNALVEKKDAGFIIDLEKGRERLDEIHAKLNNLLKD